MTFFPFDLRRLESLSDKDKKEAALAAATAEEVARYYQDSAVEMVDGEGQHENVKHPNLSTAQMLLANEALMIVQSQGKVQGSTTARAGLKLFMATQMDFYRRSPQYLDALNLNGNPTKEEALFKALQYMRHVMGDTFAPVDEYFEESFKSLEKWIKTQQEQDGRMKPALKPVFNTDKKPEDEELEPENNNVAPKPAAPSPYGPFGGLRP